jgi:type I restriction enzyme S subunit
MKNNSYYSGEDWIGSIPASWRLLRIGSLFKCRNVKVDDTEYPPLSVSKGGIVPQMDSVAKTDANDNRKQVLVGDFVINSRSDRKQSCGVSRLQGSVSLINTVLYPITDLIDSDYLDLLLKNYGFAEEFYRWGHGIVSDLWTTRWQEMSSIVIPVPPINRQKEIAIDVSSKKKAIESLLQNETKQIEKLNEYKASLITEAVTKGISGEPETKKSGVEWIGDIPASWSVIKLKYATYIRARLGWKGLKAEEYVPSGYPLLSAFNIINSKLDFSDVNFINKQRYDESPEIKLKNNRRIYKSVAGEPA